MKKTAQTDSAAGPSNVDGSSIGFEDDEITLDLLMVCPSIVLSFFGPCSPSTLQDEQLPIYSTGMQDTLHPLFYDL